MTADELAWLLFLNQRDDRKAGRWQAWKLVEKWARADGFVASEAELWAAAQGVPIRQRPPIQELVLGASEVTLTRLDALARQGCLTDDHSTVSLRYGRRLCIPRKCNLVALAGRLLDELALREATLRLGDDEAAHLLECVAGLAAFSEGVLQ